MRKVQSLRTQRRIGRVLRQLRLERGLSQKAVAKSLGRPQSYVSKYERGQSSVRLVELPAICRALGVDIQTMMERFAASLSEFR